MPARFYLRIYSYLLLRIIYYIRYFDYAYASLNMTDKKAFLTTLNMTGEKAFPRTLNIPINALRYITYMANSARLNI